MNTIHHRVMTIMIFFLQQTCRIFLWVFQPRKLHFPFYINRKKEHASNASSKILHYVMFVNPCQHLLRNSAALPTDAACNVFKIQSVNKYGSQANTGLSLLHWCSYLGTEARHFSYTNSLSNNPDLDLVNFLRFQVFVKLNSINVRGAKRINITELNNGAH